jgi:hypothetical protein
VIANYPSRQLKFRVYLESADKVSLSALKIASADTYRTERIYYGALFPDAEFLDGPGALIASAPDNVLVGTFPSAVSVQSTGSAGHLPEEASQFTVVIASFKLLDFRVAKQMLRVTPPQSPSFLNELTYVLLRSYSHLAALLNVFLLI